MLPIVDKPSIQYVVEEAVRAGLRDIVVVTGRGKSTIEDHFDRSYELEHDLERDGKPEVAAQLRAIAELARMHYVRQGEALGLGHAIGMARDHVGGNPFACLLGDDIFHEQALVLQEMLAVHTRFGHTVLALKEVPRADISLYGSAIVEEIDDRVMRVTGVVEKPNIEDAPSNLAVIGRYVFTPNIFDAIDDTAPGHGGEIQITDAIALLMKEQPVYGWTFQHGRYDAGSKLDYLRATVEFALERADIGPPFRDMLRNLLDADKG